MNSCLCSVLELELIKDEIKRRSATIVSLQFPDCLLKYASLFLKFIQEEIPRVQFFILADTSYGSCCVDEVAAEHVKSDLILHFGHTCLSPTSRLPVIFLFGENPIVVTKPVEYFSKVLRALKDSSSILLLSDPKFNTAIPSLLSHLKLEFTYHFHYPIIDNLFDPNSLVHHRNMDSFFLNRSIFPPVDFNSGQFPFNVILYVGDESPFLTTLMMGIGGKCPIFSYSPSLSRGREEGTKVNVSLSKRYAQVQKTLKGTFVGILVGTLGINKYLSVITQVQSLAIRAGKKPYIISVGKVNVAKLANFLDIDFFVLISCPETTSTFDACEFLRPIISPYEFRLSIGEVIDSLTSESIFTLWSPDFHYFLNEQKTLNRTDEIKVSQSAINGRGTKQIEYDWENSTSALRLSSKEFQGLQFLSNIELDTHYQKNIEEGASGIPMAYQSEHN